MSWMWRRRRRRNRGAGVILGPVLVGAALLCLWGNEGRFDYHAAAKRARVVSEAEHSRDAEAIAFSGSLEPVTFSGDYVTQFENYLAVFRTAEIYCWVRKRRDNHDTWRQEWRSSVHRNSRNSGITQTLQSRVIKPNAYHLNGLEILPAELHFPDETVNLSASNLPLSTQGKNLGLRINDAYYYLKQGAGSGNQLGDERIRYRAVPAASTASYFGSIEEGVGQVKVFERKSGFVSKFIKDDGVLHHLVNGDRETALATLKGHIQRLRWMVRGVGTLVVMVGISVTLSSVLHLLMGVPLLGRLVQGGVFWASVLIGGLLAVGTIVVSWFAHHPILTLFVIVGVIGIGMWLGRKRSVSTANASKVLTQLESTAGSTSGGESDRASVQRAEHVFQHLVKIAVSDGNYDQTENQFLADWARARNISDERIVTLFEEAKGEKDVLAVVATREDLFYLISLSLADGHLSLKELKRIRRFAQDLQIDEAELEAIISNIRDGKLEQDPA